VLGYHMFNRLHDMESRLGVLAHGPGIGHIVSGERQASKSNLRRREDELSVGVPRCLQVRQSIVVALLKLVFRQDIRERLSDVSEHTKEDWPMESGPASRARDPRGRDVRAR
jgi:hypothetical protein